MSLHSKSTVQFLRSKAIIKDLRIQGRSSIMMPVTLSKRKDLLLLVENYVVDAIAIHYPNSIKAHLLQFHKTTKKVVHDFGQTILVLSRMTLHLINKIWIPISNSQKIRIMDGMPL